MKNTVGIGIIGGGRIGKVHAENLCSLIPRAEVKAMADPLANEELRLQAGEWGIHQIHLDYKKILSNPEVDAVLICSSTDTHAEIVREAARAGKHVFCEKPLDQDPLTIRDTLAVVRDSGVIFQIGFNRRFDHNFQALRRSVAAGDLGDIHLLSIISRDPAPPPLGYIRSSGGLFMDMAIHDFDMARFLVGSEVIKVHAAGGVLIDQAIGQVGDIDTAITTLWFENGSLGVISNSRKAAYGYDQRAEILGSLGAARTENDLPSTLILSNSTHVRREKPLYFFLERYKESFAEEIRQFIRAIIEGTEVLAGENDALKSVEIALAAKESLEKGVPVELSP